MTRARSILAIFGSAVLALACAPPSAPVASPPPIASSPPSPPPLDVEPMPLGLDTPPIPNEATPDERARLLRVHVALVLRRASRADPEPKARDVEDVVVALKTELRRPGAVFTLDDRLVLASALERRGHSPEARHVLRAIVCPSLYPYPSPDDPPAADAPWLGPKVAQEQAFDAWQEWEKRHPMPLDAKPARGKKPIAKAAPDPEVIYASPYAKCPQADSVQATVAWARLASAEHRLGDAGPFTLNRVAEAYGFARASTVDTWDRRVATFSLANIEVQRGRYHAAVDLALAWLRDRNEKHQAEGGDELDADAIDLIGDALVHSDFEGGPATDPFIERPDALDTEPNPVTAEHILLVGLQRLRDPHVVAAPTPAMFLALAAAYGRLALLEDRVATLQEFLVRFPSDPAVGDVNAALVRAHAAIELRRPKHP